MYFFIHETALDAWQSLFLPALILLALICYLLFKRQRSLRRFLLPLILSLGNFFIYYLTEDFLAIQLSPFVIILAGLTLGAGKGFIIGVCSILLSTLWLGMISTWLMLGMGIAGGLAGILQKPLLRYKLLRVAYGMAWGFFFGAMMAHSLSQAIAIGLLIALCGNAGIRILSQAGIKSGYVINRERVTKMGIKKIICPSLYPSFECLGNACKDTCCRPKLWEIYVDNRSIKKYRAAGGEFGALLKKHIIHKNGGWQFDNSDHTCVFLNDHQLCDLRVRFGEDFLCHTCKTYPRESNPFNGIDEWSLALTCPKAVETILVSGQDISFVEPAEMRLKPISPIQSPVWHEAAAYRVRGFIFDVLLSEDLSLLDKLLFVGVFVEELSTIPRYGLYAKKTNQLIKKHQEKLSDTFFKTHQHKKNINPENRSQMLMGLTLKVIKLLLEDETDTPAPINPNPLQVKLDAFHDLNKRNHTAVNAKNNMDNLVLPLLNKKERIFTHYLLYKMYVNQFPKGIKNPKQEYKYFVGEFLTLLVYTAGFYESESEITNEHLTDAIYTFHRYMEPIRLREEILDELIKHISIEELILYIE